MTGDVQVLTFEGGGSGRGMSYYEKAMLCPRACKLNEERKERMAVKDHNFSGMFRADIGTVFHKLAEIYHSGADATVEVADPAGEPALAEGQRIFAAYTARFEPGFWGEVIDVEMHLPGEHAASCPAKTGPQVTCNCGVAARARKMEELFGVEFTGRIDMVIRVNEADCARINRKTGMTLKPGVYLLDHKTKGRRDSDMSTVMHNSMQFWAYQLAYNELNPDEKCQGMIANIVIGHKKMTDDSFIQLLCPAPTGDEEVIVGTFLHNANGMAKSNMPNAAYCFVRGVCPHFTSGRCGRS